MEYPKYLKLKTTKFYVKLIDENNNLHFRKSIDGFVIDCNASPNKFYSLGDFIGCSRNEFDREYIKVVEKLNEITKI